MTGHELRQWSKRRRVPRRVPIARRVFHAECTCGWSGHWSSRGDRRVDVEKHRLAARWQEVGAARPYGTSTR